MNEVVVFDTVTKCKLYQGPTLDGESYGDLLAAIAIARGDTRVVRTDICYHEADQPQGLGRYATYLLPAVVRFQEGSYHWTDRGYCVRA